MTEQPSAMTTFQEDAAMNKDFNQMRSPPELITERNTATPI